MKIALIFCFLSFPLSSFAAISIIPADELPAELKFLYHSAKYEKGEELQQMKSSLQIIDASFEKISKEDRSFLIKSEIYKALMAKSPEKYQEGRPNDNALLKEFLSATEKQTIPFFRWLASALRRDLKLLSESPHFQSLLQKMNSTRPLNNNEDKLKSRLSLILPWVRLLKSAEKSEKKDFINEFAQFVTKKLSLITYQYVSYSQFEDFTPMEEKEKLTHFEIKELAPKEEKKEQDKVERIVEEVIKDPKLLPTPVPGWRPSGNMEKSPEPDPDYSPPENFPKPVNDWMEDL